MMVYCKARKSTLKCFVIFISVQNVKWLKPMINMPSLELKKTQQIKLLDGALSAKAAPRA